LTPFPLALTGLRRYHDRSLQPEEVNVQRMTSCLVLALFGFLLGPDRIFPQAKKIELRTVNLEGLKQAVLKQRGKVLIVDFWGDF
jgi:hypothetical protein